MRLAGREIGPRHPPYIIAELGVNHDGSVERALELTRAAAGAGADAVKLQLFQTDRLMSKAAKLAAYQRAAGETDPIAMLRRLELSIDDMARVVRLAHELQVHAIVTVFSVELVEMAERLPWDAYKTASPDIVHRPLLEALAATGKPMIVSTGASTMEEVERAAGWLEAVRERLALMQCVSCYPTEAERAELGGIGAIRSETGLVTGYSDHTPSVEMGAEAVRAGARLLEKHFTYDRSARGPDHAASLEPATFARYAQLVRAVREGQHGGGTGDKRVLEIERDVRTVSRQSIVAARTLRAGERLERGDVTFKRPGTGIAPFRVEEVMGRVMARDVECDVPVREEDIRW